ncbi:MAG: glutamate-5-semialdehyde dehydrogenase [Dehalococcoidia bacterium]|nr:glutamate-5-semialdehyde dehydrogenase [Dehalococcoidia bacterium]
MATTVRTDAATEARTKGAAARRAARVLARTPTAVKNQALRAVAEALSEQQDEVLAANREDMAAAEAADLSQSTRDRLLLTPARLEAIAADVRDVAALPDPVGEIMEMRTVESGIQVGRQRVPLGVIGVIYEARPNVTIDIASLAIKSGNTVVLRGGSDAIQSNLALAKLISRVMAEAGLPEGIIQLIETTDRQSVTALLQARGLIDVIIPRGGAGLINYCVENSTVPVIETGAGVCHTYVDQDADVEKAHKVAFNAKVRRPSICNALDTLLVHEAIAPRLLPALADELAGENVEMRCDSGAAALLTDRQNVTPASEADYGTEFLDYIMAVKLVPDLDTALDHIAHYGSGHSEAIVTESYTAGQRFMGEVDAAAVYWNVSTQFTDGAQFGLGAEVGISTQKLHARGPMALREMTTYKWIIYGDGHTRP